MPFPILFSVPWLCRETNPEQYRRTLKCIEKTGSKVGKVKVQPGFALFLVDRAFSPRASAVENGRALQALLDCLVKLNHFYLADNPNTPPLFQSGVVYRRTNIWDTTPTLIARTFGDCKSLSATRVAELQRANYSVRPIFRFMKLDQYGRSIPIVGIPGGAIFDNAKGVMYHILLAVVDNNGKISFEDPSKILGMQVRQENMMLYDKT